MQDKSPGIGIVIPVRNESGNLQDLLEYLQPMRPQVLFVDGESTDDTVQRCQRAGFSVTCSTTGRAHQMNVGASQQPADIYWFLHADCLPPARAPEEINKAIDQGYQWGRFNVRLTGNRWIFRVIERFMNWRSCFTQVATGDQGLFVSRELFEHVGGFPEIALMEDIAITKALRHHGRGACLSSTLAVSSRRWEQKGIYRTILLMWWLRLRYYLGSDPDDLHRAYYG